MEVLERSHGMFESMLLILIVGVSAILQILVHEAGHLVFGLATGYLFYRTQFQDL